MSNHLSRGKIVRNLLFPATAILFIPSGLLLPRILRRGLSISPLRIVQGLPAVLTGLLLLSRSAILIYFSQETPLWDKPSQHLRMHGPYRYVRNPMALGTLLIILGEGITFRSKTIAIWAIGFFALSHWLAVRVEEPSLRASFAATYEHYYAATPRWLPRPSYKRESTSQIPPLKS
jgi:protein-S-isoprenylcysteine O-methyltransferase Ste14